MIRAGDENTRTGCSLVLCVEGNNITTEFDTQTKLKIFIFEKQKHHFFFNSLALTNKKQKQAGPTAER